MITEVIIKVLLIYFINIYFQSNDYHNFYMHCHDVVYIYIYIEIAFLKHDYKKKCTKYVIKFSFILCLILFWGNHGESLFQ